MTWTRHRSKLLAICSTVVLVAWPAATGSAAAALPAAGQSRANAPPQPQQLMEQFQSRLAEYVVLQRAVEKALPPVARREDPERVDARRERLAERMREARKSARRGDLFGEAGDLIREILSRDQTKRSRVEQSKALEDVPTRIQPTVNALYPTEAPLATVPPLLLQQLPRVPEGLEYRFMERDLILRDTHANLIADVLPDVFPPR